MSVANVAVLGDRIYCISEWNIVKTMYDGTQKTFEFHIGEEVMFLDAYFKNDFDFGPNSWQVRFRAKSGFIGETADCNFVMEDDWNKLKIYFKKSE